MKESVEFVQALVALANPWTIGIALIVAAPFVFRHLLEISTLSLASREKKLTPLLKYVDAGIDKSARYSVEQAFRLNYGVLIDYDIIERLWSNVAASAHIQNYIWGQSFLSFDRDTRKFSLRKKYNWKLRGAFLVVAFGASYLVAAVSFIAALVLISNGHWNDALKSLSLGGVMATGVVVIVLAARAARAARDVVEQQDLTVPSLSQGEPSPCGDSSGERPHLILAAETGELISKPHRKD